MKKKFLIVTTVSDSLPFFKGQISVLKQVFNIELVASAGIQMDEMCQMHDVKGHKVKMKREISLLSDIKSLIQLTFLFFKLKPYIVHGNTPKGSLLSMIAAWINQVPVRIYYVHGLRYHGEIGNKQKLLQLIEKLTCRLATHIVGVSEGVRQNIINDKLTSKNVFLIGNGSVNGIDLNYFNAEKYNPIEIKIKFDINQKDFIFGFVGRLVGDKGINELVAAFVKLNQEFKNIKLILAGKYEDQIDPLKSETLEIINNNNNIVNFGFQTDVRPILTIMNVFTFPSYREGFGIVLMEAAAMKVPAISTDIIGCNEVVVDGKSGFLIESKNQEALYLKMKYFVQNPELSKIMGANAKEIVTKKFEQNAHWEKALQFYKNNCK